MITRENFIKKLLYKSRNRGCKETDLILGTYAKQKLHTKNDLQLLIFADFLELPDQLIYNWYIQKEIADNKDYQEIIEDIIDSFTHSPQNIVN